MCAESSRKVVCVPRTEQDTPGQQNKHRDPRPSAPLWPWVAGADIREYRKHVAGWLQILKNAPQGSPGGSVVERHLQPRA